MINDSDINSAGATTHTHLNVPLPGGLMPSVPPLLEELRLLLEPVVFPLRHDLVEGDLE